MVWNVDSPMVMVPVAVRMKVVVAGDVVIVIPVPHPFARMIVPMARIVPGMAPIPTVPTQIRRPIVTDVPAPVVRPAEVDMVTGPGNMDPEVTSLRFIT